MEILKTKSEKIEALDHVKTSTPVLQFLRKAGIIEDIHCQITEDQYNRSLEALEFKSWRYNEFTLVAVYAGGIFLYCNVRAAGRLIFGSTDIEKFNIQKAKYSK